MTATITVGIDVCKDRLDIYVHPLNQSFALPNTDAGFRSLAKRLAALHVHCVAMEATGGMQNKVALALQSKGYVVHVINPARIWAWRRVIGKFAKNDNLDARLIALFAETMLKDHTPIPLSETQLRLSALATRREQLSDQVADDKKRLGQTDFPEIKESLEHSIAGNSKAIKQMEVLMMNIIKADPELLRRYQLLYSIPAVGEIVAMSVVALLPELGHLSHKQLASLVGVAPHISQSGASKGHAHIRGGRTLLRKKLFMAAKNVPIHNPVLAEYAAQLKQRGKSYKEIMIALINKLLHIMNAMLINNKPWQNDYSPKLLPTS